MTRDRQDAALLASCALIAFACLANWSADSPQFKRYAWHNVVAKEHCYLTTDTGAGRRVYACDDGYRVEYELKTMSQEGI
ncbi:hypothetical protein AYM40_35225 [Paraburkholderia phytofirmans OLGA172]|uniref:Secreted protein n=1 Tax=Paraburkholderia phytofirmans OLGA172 TaxID=1417228 RepID=A0A160FVX4_9BURK|nr:hypothetical protein [Paraburkholderia phytofirmans]ANB77334.1 hypothetical protein AYM40_35225 [Paraburkholderia phytofirmans OLGA172]